MPLPHFGNKNNIYSPDPIYISSMDVEFINQDKLNDAIFKLDEEYCYCYLYDNVFKILKKLIVDNIKFDIKLKRMNKIGEIIFITYLKNVQFVDIIIHTFDYNAPGIQDIKIKYTYESKEDCSLFTLNDKRKFKLKSIC